MKNPAQLICNLNCGQQFQQINNQCISWTEEIHLKIWLSTIFKKYDIKQLNKKQVIPIVVFFKNNFFNNIICNKTLYKTCSTEWFFEILRINCWITIWMYTLIVFVIVIILTTTKRVDVKWDWPLSLYQLYKHYNKNNVNILWIIDLNCIYWNI